jgi:hypothetical protein
MRSEEQNIIPTFKKSEAKYNSKFHKVIKNMKQIRWFCYTFFKSEAKYNSKFHKVIKNFKVYFAQLFLKVEKIEIFF